MPPCLGRRVIYCMFCPTVVKRNLMFNSHCKGQRQHPYSGCCNRGNCANIRNPHEEMGTGSLRTQRLSCLQPFLCEILIVTKSAIYFMLQDLDYQWYWWFFSLLFVEHAITYGPRTADVSPRSSPLRDVSRGETSFSGDELGETSAVRKLYYIVICWWHAGAV